MSVLAIVPFLESLGTTELLIGAGEAFTGTTAGTALKVGAGLTTTIVGAQIGKKVDEKLIEAYTNLVPESAQEQAQNLTSQFTAGAQSVLTGDPSFLIKNYVDKKNIEPQIETNIIDEDDIYNQESGKVDDITEYSFENPFSNVPQLGQADKPKATPKDIAKVIIETSKELVETGDPLQATQNVIRSFPELSGLTADLTTYLSKKSLPDTEQYRQIAEVYNGNGITINNY